MAANPQIDDFIGDIERLQATQTSPQQAQQYDFFSDLEAAKQTQAPSKIQQFPLQTAQAAAQENLQQPAPSPATPATRSKAGDFFTDLQEVAAPQQSQQAAQKATPSKFPFLAPGSDTLEKPTVAEKKQNKLVESFVEGMKESASGELAQLSFGEFEQRAQRDPSFWSDLVHEAGVLSGDAPYMVAGSVLGGAIGTAAGSVGGPFAAAAGGILGGGAGAIAVPTFLKESIKEYRDYAKEGHDLTFGEFLERADRVGSKTLNQGLFGAILGMTQKTMPLLKQVPGLGKLFETKAGEVAGKVALESGVAVGAPALAEGKLPSGSDYAKALALFTGFNLAHAPFEMRETINREGKQSGLSPEEYAKSLDPEQLSRIQKAVDTSIYKEAKREQLPEKPKVEAEKPQFEVEETRGQGKQFHGSPTELTGVDKWYYNPMNYYGQGFYTTDAADIARGYSNRRVQGEKQPTIYEVTPKHEVKLLDMETPLSEVDPKAMEVVQKEAAGQFGASYVAEMALSEKPENLRELYDLVRDIGTGEGLSAAEIQEVFEGFQTGFERLGYRGLTHTGGLRTKNKPHIVRIYFDPEADLTIKKTELPLRRKVSEKFQEQMLGHAEKATWKKEEFKNEFIEKIKKREIGNAQEANEFLRSKTNSIYGSLKR